MAMVHYLYVGHFVPEDGYVRFQGHEPTVARPINMQSVAALLSRYLGEAVGLEDIPARWGMSILPSRIVCDLIHSPAEALRFAADYAEQEGALLLDQGAFSLLTPEQVRQSATVNSGQA
jgi:hypothetical protein